jgi:hypothetical protein
MSYGWILLENLNHLLQISFFALLVVTTVAGISFFTESSWDWQKEEWVRFALKKRQYFRVILGILLLLATVLVALPSKDQIALLRGECPCGAEGRQDSTEDRTPKKAAVQSISA